MCTQQHFKVYPATKHLRSLAVTERSCIIPLAGAGAVAAKNVFFKNFALYSTVSAKIEGGNVAASFCIP
jgi:hypothetical protein